MHALTLGLRAARRPCCPCCPLLPAHLGACHTYTLLPAAQACLAARYGAPARSARRALVKAGARRNTLGSP
jgi:hypothetical protein